jgi:hypothetical protein
MSDIFERASRERLRIDTPAGALTVEDLWTVPLRSRTPNSLSLDLIAKDVYTELKKQEEITSFVDDDAAPSKQKATLELAMDILKHIIAYRKAESARQEDLQKKKALQQNLLRIKADRQAANMENLTDEELDKMIADCSN